ncbi:hypothetical protein QVD17_37577 [Tagetes erecta]|uniref:Uncharacterized protein n=1 Tax=Tagetes erecta TaxID=13708 RepID=A0AAD8NK54_TARER|nr:hypothetical protein QVD17_37577 [Tagetes erecta]
MGITANMKTLSCLVLIMLVCLSQKARADTLCMRECPSQCMKHNTEAQDIECYFFCVLNCEKCPNSPTGCPPDEETTKKLAEADMNGMVQLLIKAQTQASLAPA